MTTSDDIGRLSIEELRQLNGELKLRIGDIEARIEEIKVSTENKVKKISEPAHHQSHGISESAPLSNTHIAAGLIVKNPNY